MSNPFESSFDNEFNVEDNEQVKEGLLCPFCFTDFKTVVRLQEHFAAVHNDEKEEPKKLSTHLKGFIGKAKKILKSDTFEEVSALEVTPQREPLYYHIWRESQQIGQTFNHFDYFQNIRDSRITRYVIETNKLLIRLDKLMKDAPTDPEKRKQHEKRCVEWVNDADVKLCPNCAKSFNISRRRHHCRLCGGIMCHNCSQFLEFEYATKLISPTNLSADTFLSSPMNSSFNSGLTRRGSNSSLMSMVNSSGEPHIRVCRDCKVLLDRRNQLVEDQVTKPFVTHLYDKLKVILSEADKLVPIYYQMCASLSEGENNYKLRDAQEVRIKLMKVAESIDVISRKISNLDVTNEQQPLSASQLKVQMNIRLMCTQYLRENMLGLPSLPSEEELLKRQERRREEIQQRIEEEKRQALLEAEMALNQQRSLHSSPSSRSMNSLPKVHSSNDLVSPDTGWGPEFTLRSNCDVSNMDPMLVQINIIKNYIKKAREEHKYDEVSILELNLKELEINYMLQQKE
ncbi:rabenosyn-5-like protein [Leptotrombidium deliense]|uniref:Rabenosyn-5-like protein n=1 Tax=Leptotrombidium deliense TaxID=299467 RepID=A0A443SLB4_9ACAR|nr:rabenosyn-5-like protein [Leptotrombidium deliense]